MVLFVMGSAWILKSGGAGGGRECFSGRVVKGVKVYVKICFEVCSEDCVEG